MRHDWNIASNIMAWLAALQGATIQPEKLNPLAEITPHQQDTGEPDIHISILKTVFVDQQPGVAVRSLLGK
jgi:hypothetical protein